MGTVNFSQIDNIWAETIWACKKCPETDRKAGAKPQPESWSLSGFDASANQSLWGNPNLAHQIERCNKSPASFIVREMPLVRIEFHRTDKGCVYCLSSECLSVVNQSTDVYSIKYPTELPWTQLPLTIHQPKEQYLPGDLLCVRKTYLSRLPLRQHPLFHPAQQRREKGGEQRRTVNIKGNQASSTVVTARDKGKVAKRRVW